MSYMQDLRQIAGTRPLIMIGSTLLMLNQSGQLLMIKRTDNHCWGVPGGAMEIGERLEETVKRETLEEIGIELDELEFFGVYSGQELYYQYPDGAEVYNVSAVYLTTNTGEEITVNPDEHAEYKYFDLNNLPGEISPPIKPILRDLVKRQLLKAGD
jgi:8-oxo-dGTP pyrophosphatase MutT (NUDIX family)